MYYIGGGKNTYGQANQDCKAGNRCEEDDCRRRCRRGPSCCRWPWTHRQRNGEARLRGRRRRNLVPSHPRPCPQADDKIMEKYLVIFDPVKWPYETYRHIFNHNPPKAFRELALKMLEIQKRRVELYQS